MIKRYDLSFVVDEPEEMVGYDIFSLAFLSQILEDAGYETTPVPTVFGDAGYRTLMLKRKKDPK